MEVAVFAGDRHTRCELQSTVHLRQLHLSTTVGWSLLQSDCHVSPREEIQSSGFGTVHIGAHLSLCNAVFFLGIVGLIKRLFGVWNHRLISAFGS